METQLPYLHGFNQDEQERLYRQAEFLEQAVFRGIDFSRAGHILEVGCGVGAQTTILRRRFPRLRITGIDMSEKQLATARTRLSDDELVELRQMNAQAMTFEHEKFDGAFLCWILEHVPDPLRVLTETRRRLQPGARIYITEVMNSTFFLDPYSPHTWKYWMAFNDYQNAGAGDPFVGAKLGNLLTAAGFRDVRTEPQTLHFDRREPVRRAEVVAYWTELLLSAADQLIAKGYTDAATVSGMKGELDAIRANEDAVFFYAFMQATATT